MIMVDDSGWGSLLGGVAIGLYDTDKRKFKYKIVPVSYFKAAKWRSGLYRHQVVKVFNDMWKSMGEVRNLQICRGTVLDGIIDYLNNKGMNPKCFTRIEIGNPLQSLLEEKFAESLEKIGVPRLSSGAHCLSFEGQLDWVKEDPKRIKYVKTGWPSWQSKYLKEILK